MEQWCIRVPRSKGEETRQLLLHEGTLDRFLKIRREGEELFIPVIGPVEGAIRAIFEEGPARQELARHELVGGIAILQDRDPNAAKAILASRPNLHTVLFPTSEVQGEYRTRSFEVLAGEDTTRTRVTEYGHTFIVDLAAAYFSARLSTERQRLRALVRPGERILDMFAGVGPFAISLASGAHIVAACDLNPGAVLLMRENVVLNHTGNVLPFLADAGHLREMALGPFDRIVMNLPLAATRFLPEAFSLVRPGGTIHLYSLQSVEREILPAILACGPADVNERFVRSYSPSHWHAVYDIIVNPLPGYE
ncbi:MAG: class I SAM-dependent methyltransferase family protein [Methanoregulaceae archaeon]